MVLTAIVLAIFIGVFILSLLLYVTSLRLGLRWAKAEGVTWKKIASAIGLSIALSIGVNVLCKRLMPTSVEDAYGLLFAQAVATTLGSAWIYQGVFQLRFWPAVKVWFATFLAALVQLPIIYFLFIPYGAESFKAAGNSMAPTILGDYQQGNCPVCGEPNYCSPPPDDFRPLSQARICKNFHTAVGPPSEEPYHQADRFLIVKCLKPQRWDVIAFRYPAEPDTLYLKRLVGLPGEKIEIFNGKVWADGKQLVPPEALSKIEYLDHIPGDRPVPASELWGTRERPAQLGQDEYFVLGDFSRASNDSRLWQKESADHPPFALPGTNIVGVATHIYWPLSRWTLLR